MLHDIKLYHAPRAPRIIQQLIFLLRDESIFNKIFISFESEEKIILHSHMLDVLFGLRLSCISFVLGWQMWTRKYFMYAFRGILHTSLA
jgi:hypothetical protein